MGPYYRLIKDRTIDFCPLLLNKYHLLGLTEVDTVILIKLHEMLKQGVKKLSASKLAPSMTTTANTISKRLVDLVKNGFISLAITEDSQSEEFHLDETYKRLGNLLDKDQDDSQFETVKNATKEIVTLLEGEFKKMLTPLDLEMVHHWIYEDKFSIDQITQAILACVKVKKLNLKYVDIFLNKKEENKETNKVENLQELFNNIYDKRK